jgi:hypothetical protein
MVPADQSGSLTIEYAIPGCQRLPAATATDRSS